MRIAMWSGPRNLSTAMMYSFGARSDSYVVDEPFYAAYLALREAGEAHGMKLFGALAVDSMRMEKGYLHWKAEILTEFDPFETGLERFVDMGKPDFIGKDALSARQKKDLQKQLVTLRLESKIAAAHGGASLMDQGRVVGTVTSGAFGHRTGLNIAYAFVEPSYASIGASIEIDVLGEMVPAQVVEKSLYDAENLLVRS